MSIIFLFFLLLYCYILIFKVYYFIVFNNQSQTIKKELTRKIYNCIFGNYTNNNCFIGKWTYC